MAQSVGNAIGAVGGTMKYFEGRKMQREAQKFIDNFEYDELNNAYENNQVSTLGAELRTEQANMTTAASVDALRSGGTRALVGGLGRVQAQNNLVSREIAANLDEQQKRIDFAVSQDNVRLRDMQERRQAEELAGYGQMLNVGMDMKYQGIADVQASAQAQGEHNMELFETFGGVFTGGMGGGMG